MTFLLEIGLGVIVFMVFLHTVEAKYFFREKFQKRYGRGQMRIPVILLSFILIVFVATLLQVLVTSIPFFLERESIVTGVRLGLLIYLLHIINPFIADKK